MAAVHAGCVGPPRAGVEGTEALNVKPESSGFGASSGAFSEARGLNDSFIHSSISLSFLRLCQAHTLARDWGHERSMPPPPGSQSSWGWG